MSNLDECIRQANAAGISYGQYMNESFDPAAAKPVAEEEEEDLAAIGTKVCQWCGKEFKVYDKRQHKYCCRECRVKAQASKAKKKKREANKMEEETKTEVREERAAEGNGTFMAVNDDTIHPEIRLKEDVRIRYAIMILENARKFESETGYLISILDALEILKDEGARNA